MKRVVMTPNPYRDRDFACVRQAQRILEEAGVEVKICLAFDVDPSFQLPEGVPISNLQEELKSAEALICFGGDGTILHSSKLAMRRNIPILGVNIGTVGFMAELESGEMEQLARLARDDYRIDERMTLYVRLLHEGRVIYRDVALNDAVVTKGAVARVIQTAVFLDGVEAMNFSGNPASQIWRLVMAPIHENLPYKDFPTPDVGEPTGIFGSFYFFFYMHLMLLFLLLLLFLMHLFFLVFFGLFQFLHLFRYFQLILNDHFLHLI